MTVARQFLAGLKLLLALTLLVGLGYPLAMTGLAQLVFHARANGSLVTSHGQPVGSALLGQPFSGARWFHPRPSAAGTNGYDALASAGTNLGPSSLKLEQAVGTARAAAARANGVAPSAVPPDAVTSSGSGLDPDISPANADEQVGRVARSRGLPVETVRRLVAAHVIGRTLGFLGEPHVNVLQLNRSLAKLAGGRR